MFNNIKRIKQTPLFLVLICYFAGTGLVYATKGDVFYITGSLVNIRANSTTESAIVARISKGRTVEEITRKSGWVKVKILGTDQQGWVHTALLNYRKPVLTPDEEELISHAPSKIKEPVAKKNVQQKAVKKVGKKVEVKVPVVAVDALEKFSNGFNLFKDKKMADTGSSQFGSVDDKGDGVLHINVTDDWLKTSHQGKKKDLKQIFDMWSSARANQYSAIYLMDRNSSIPVAIYIKDKKGKIHTAVRK